MIPILDDEHRHLLLHKYDLSNNSFVYNVNELAKNIKAIKGLNDKLTDEEIEKLLTTANGVGDILAYANSAKDNADIADEAAKLAEECQQKACNCATRAEGAAVRAEDANTNVTKLATTVASQATATKTNADKATAAAASAEHSATIATEKATDATNAMNNARQYATNAAASATQASTSAGIAATNATSASASAANAAESEAASQAIRTEVTRLLSDANIINTIVKKLTSETGIKYTGDRLITAIYKALAAVLTETDVDEYVDSDDFKAALAKAVGAILSDKNSPDSKALREAIAEAVKGQITTDKDFKDTLVNAVVDVLNNSENAAAQKLQNAILAALTNKFATDKAMLSLFQAALGVPITLTSNLEVCVALNANTSEGIAEGIDKPTYQNIIDIAKADAGGDASKAIFKASDIPAGSKTTSVAAAPYLVLVGWGLKWDRPFKSINTAMTHVAALYNLSTFDVTIRVATGVYGRIGDIGKFNTNTGTFTVAPRIKYTSEPKTVLSAAIPSNLYTVAGNGTFTFSSGVTNGSADALEFFANEYRVNKQTEYDVYTTAPTGYTQVASWYGYAVVKNSTSNTYHFIAKKIEYNYDDVVITYQAAPFTSTVTDVEAAVANLPPLVTSASTYTLLRVREAKYIFAHIRFYNNLGANISYTNLYASLCSALDNGILEFDTCKFDFYITPKSAQNKGNSIVRLISVSNGGSIRIQMDNTIYAPTGSTTISTGTYCHVVAIHAETNSTVRIGQSVGTPVSRYRYINRIYGSFYRTFEFSSGSSVGYTSGQTYSPRWCSVPMTEDIYFDTSNSEGVVTVIDTFAYMGVGAQGINIAGIFRGADKYATKLIKAGVNSGNPVEAKLALPEGTPEAVPYRNDFVFCDEHFAMFS